MGQINVKQNAKAVYCSTVTNKTIFCRLLTLERFQTFHSTGFFIFHVGLKIQHLPYHICSMFRPPVW